MTPDLGHLALLLDSSLHDHGLERDIIEAAGGTLVVTGVGVWHHQNEQQVLDHPHLAEAAVILVEHAPVTRRVLEKASSCAAVVRYGVGVDNVDIPAATAAGIWVANVPDYATDTVADHAIMLLLAVARDLLGFSEKLRHGGWRGDPEQYTPVALAGIEATDCAARSVRLSASGVLMSGLGAPARTATPMPMRATSRKDCGANCARAPASFKTSAGTTARSNAVLLVAILTSSGAVP